MKKCDKIFTGLICLFFLGMSLLYVVLPSRAFSPLEKRYLDPGTDPHRPKSALRWFWGRGGKLHG